MSDQADDTGVHWHAAQLKPNGLNLARIHLARQGFQALMPMLPVSKRLRNRRVQKQDPLFPGYIFIGFDPGGFSWRKINSTTGIGRLVCGLDSLPARLPREFIRQLELRMDDQGRLKPTEELAPGTKVRITAGPFATWVAEVESCTKDKRVNLLLSLMGRIVRTNLSRPQIEVV